MLYRLIVLTGPLKNQRITVGEEPMTVGRAADCQIVLTDDEVATRHAELTQRPEVGLHIRDLGTMNSIIVNGRELRESRLKHGDMVEIGRTRFLVQAVVQAEVSGSDADPEERGSPKVVAAAAVVFVLAVITWVRWPELHGRKDVAMEGGATNEIVAVAAPPMAVVSNRLPEAAAPISVAGDNQATQATTEIQRMREDLLALRQTVRDIVQPAVVTNVAPVIVVAPEPPPVVVAPAPAAVIAQPERPEQEVLLQQARALIAQGDAAGADAVLDGLQRRFPEFLAAYEERARLAEAGGDTEKAATQWQHVLKRTTDSPLYQRALAERARLVKRDVPTPKPPVVATVVTSAPATRIMRVLSVEQMRFPAGEDFDDMRTINITLSQTDPTTEIVNEDVSVSVVFYDEDESTNSVHPSRLVKPVEQLRPVSGWGADRRGVVSATYVLPKGTRERERVAGHVERYYGYLVRVDYRGQKQDEWAAPRGLLKKVPNGNDVPTNAAPPPGGSQISATGRM